MIIPNYLREIAYKSTEKKNNNTIQIKCKCNNSFFYVFENESLFKKFAHFSEIKRENDKLYLVKRNFWGKIIIKKECSNEFCEKERKIIKVRCSKCGEEYLIFDNYHYGYEAVLNKTNNDSGNLKFIPISNVKQKVFVVVFYDISYQEMKEEVPDLDTDLYSLLFSYIKIYGVDNRKHIKNFYSDELA